MTPPSRGRVQFSGSKPFPAHSPKNKSLLTRLKVGMCRTMNYDSIYFLFDIAEWVTSGKQLFKKPLNPHDRVSQPDPAQSPH